MLAGNNPAFAEFAASTQRSMLCVLYLAMGEGPGQDHFQEITKRDS